MKTQRHRHPLATLSLFALLALVPSCSRSTAPAGGGGGGGTGAKELDSGNLANSAQYMHTFAIAGTFDYHCAIHGLSMSGSVVVVNGAPMNVAVTIANNNYTPATASVAPTGTITWTNTGTSTHTVTSN